MSGQIDLSGVIYLGDGVYCGHDGFQLWLYTSNGEQVTNRIALEPSVLASLLDYVKANFGPDEGKSEDDEDSDD